MPNRIIKESIRSSYEIEELDPNSEVTFYRLLTFADDYGRFPSDKRILQSQLYPLKSSIRSKDFNTWISELVKAGLIDLYIGDDHKPYGYFPTWEDHQTIRNQRSKYPEPDGDVFIDLDAQFKRVENIRNQLKSSESKCYRESNPIQSESNPNPNSSDDKGVPDFSDIDRPLHKLGNIEYSFDEFWDDYDKKKDKTKCEKKWKKIKESDKGKIKEFIPIYKAHEPDEEYRKNPLTFLNGETWKDEWSSYPPKQTNQTHNGTANADKVGAAVDNYFDQNSN